MLRKTSRVSFLLVFIGCYLSGCHGFSSKLFRDSEQVKFTSSLSEYFITKPRFSLSKHVHIQRLSLHEIKKLKPGRFYVKLKFGHNTVKLELTKNKKFLRQDFHFEDLRHGERENVYERTSREYTEKNLDCYYSGHVMNRQSSRVAVSICVGLKGFINFEDKSYLIEPMKEVRRNFLHLMYESSAELTSTHNPMKGRHLRCDTGEYSKVQTSSFERKNNHILKRRSNSHLKNHINPPAATIDLFIVADQHMVNFHGNNSLQDYVLTMMNMVSDMYKDPTLGVILDIVVVKVLMLHENIKNLDISHNGDKTLFSFCEWQFIQSLSSDTSNGRSDLSYDIALLLTRKDVCAHSDQPCGTIGLAYIGGTCTTNRKCAVVEDIGLNTAYTIAHEIGHNLGMTHDGIDNDCKMEAGGYPHMMASHWPTNNHGPLKWSSCSKKKLGEFLGSYKSYCIRDHRDEEIKSHHELPKTFPGILYDADMQCKQQYGGVSKHCTHFKLTGLPTNMCKHLWCEIEEEQECVSKLDPAAKGTKCMEGKWCMYGECVNDTSVPVAVHGGWSNWFNWTTCSRSCGVGVSFMERFCNNPFPRNGGRYCIGENRRYRTCNTQRCPEGSVDIRLLQCKQYNNKTMSYIPVHSESQPCALHCRPSNFLAHYSVRFQQKVIDGTACKHGSSDICIDGRCELLGCDLKLESKMTRDVCGICGGNGATCNLVEGEFTQPLGRGYVKAVAIPSGARNVLVKEVKPCASFLALKSGVGTYHVNGNWTIELPGEYNVNGTVVHYQRRGTQEFFHTEGPTKAKLYFMVLFQDFNFGVKYRYVLPRNKTVLNALESDVRKHQGSFGWMQGPWDKCSVACGGGLMLRQKARCLHMYKDNVSIVDDSLCFGAKMPQSLEKTCNEHMCPVVWFARPWTSCSTTCGLGRKKRIVLCKGQTPEGTWEERNPADCVLAEKPIAIHTCVEKACYLSWRSTSWSSCHAMCGKYGLKYRSVSCPIRSACLESQKPVISRKCKSPKCEYKFVAGVWGECTKTCGQGEQSRRVQCREVNSHVIANGKCSWNNIPNTIRQCYMKDCNVSSTVPPTIADSSDVIPTTTTISTKPTILLIPNKLYDVVRRAPRRKRKPSSRQLEFYDLLKSGRKTVPVMDTENCKGDQLASWACEIKIRISKYANKPFCDEQSNLLKCCESCKKQAQILNKNKIVPRKRK